MEKQKLYKPQPAYEPNKVQAYNGERGRWQDTGDDVFTNSSGCRVYVPMEVCAVVSNPVKNCSPISARRADPGRATRVVC